MARRKLGKRAEKAREAHKEKRKRASQVWSIVKDVLIALAVVILIMAAMYAYSGGIWPPMVVVESESMMHGDDSAIGVIDTGDLTLVKKIESRSDVVTYVEGRPSYRVAWEDADGLHDEETFKGGQAPFMTYDDYGEVVIYHKNGDDRFTPVIHRTIVWMEPNETADCVDTLPHGMAAGADFPDIRSRSRPDGLMCVRVLTIKGVNYVKGDLQVSVSTIVGNMVRVKGAPYAGFLTKGDHNWAPGSKVAKTDQETHSTPSGEPFLPIKVDWVVGEAVGELPWFGSLKLVLSGTTPSDRIPPSSWHGLIITIACIIIIPFIIDLVLSRISKRRREAKERRMGGKDREAEEEEEDKGEGETAGKNAARRGKGEDADDDEEGVAEGGEGVEKEEAEEEEEEDDLDDEYSEDFEDMKKG